jgi:hypothetical protein
MLALWWACMVALWWACMVVDHGLFVVCVGRQISNIFVHAPL